eukprot:TRINITY_DN20692_c0_g1_i1.p1 TRINITY_DN20692_c0_g1~~TRINITY_DN20692_c0_g1_i1.p1  ORF type:complete len:232 (-),score=57.32 TRINITY_DN20692_c0_g1_i1:122-817(-)
MIRRPPRSTHCISSAASDVYKRQIMDWNDQTQKYIRKQSIIDFIIEKYNIKEKEQTNLVDAVAKIIFYQVALGIQYLHSKQIVNRDIKPDNILFKIEECELFQHIKITDFNTSASFLTDDEKLYEFAGTPGFRGPEMQFGSSLGYLPKPCDIWSFGISLYTYIVGYIPFEGDSEFEIDVQAKNKDIHFDDKLFAPKLKDLISQCCQKAQEKRPTIQQILQHEWFKDIEVKK